MTFISIVNWLVIPVVLGILLVGGVGGLLLGCGLVVNSSRTLRFIARMNGWVSTRELFAPLDKRVDIDPAPASSRSRALLGACIALAGLVAMYLLVTRLNLARLPRLSPAAMIAVESVKWILVAGSAFAAVVGVLMLVMPHRWLELERRLNTWHSTDGVVVAGERMHMPLEARAEAHPRAAGMIIAGASLFVVIATGVLLMGRLH